METLQILGWIYLGLMLGSIGGVLAISIFQAGRVTALENEVSDLRLQRKILKDENQRLSRRGKPQPRKKRTWKRKPSKK